MFPRAHIQRRVIHQVRHSLTYIAWKDRKACVGDLKAIYQAPPREVAETKLLQLAERWGERYAVAVRSIELAFATFKALVRKAAARTREALEQAVAGAWAQVAAQDLRGFFRHCGYQLVTDLDQRLCS